MSTLEPVDFHGLKAVRLRSGDGASALVTLQGAQVVSWMASNRREQLFVSERNSFVPGHPIRGGVPVVFPQFSKRGPLAQHGFARNNPWTLVNHEARGLEAHARFAFESTPETLRLWPHPFAAELNVRLAAQHLEMELLVRNTGQGALSFTTALHTYLAVSDAAKARLEGLSGMRYEEFGNAGVDSNPGIPAEGLVDRFYFDVPEKTRLVDGDREVVISQRGFRDTVVWNPGRENTAAMADMAPDGYLRMLCVEAAIVQSAVELRPGETWTGAQHLEVTR
ncbi:MAG TPA: D-hexose-6-phosphate mutarotase [Usitatibacter sp.]